ncbi:hypothetical protein PR202_gb05410 [Eleusine coracana subsp. coracana]|uniref:Carbonic anhydrase n=1 Tax=Eleusine coracana subsp. coracana TaxID=191504 RepID=A0AAV5E754_ELECO|nr:hypothetical protein PR202_gb05410 [Eleusine coracana subsp. coracana]
MGGCCCCFPAHKPPRENPMHPAREPLIRHGPDFTTHHHPPQIITYSESIILIRGCWQSESEAIRSAQDWPVPQVTLNLKPGEAFTVRNIAGLVPAYSQRIFSMGSAIEFAVTVLKVEYIVVIGHSCCGGIRELLSLKENKPRTFHFIDDWVNTALATKKKVERENSLMSFDEQCTVLEQEVVNLSLSNLKTYPFVMDQIARGKLKLIGAHYDFVNGRFETWQP